MSILEAEVTPLAVNVRCSDSDLIVELTDGRTISVPIEWFPTLAEAQPQQREQYELLGDGEGIHWPLLDEDLSVRGLLLGTH